MNFSKFCSDIGRFVLYIDLTILIDVDSSPAKFTLLSLHYTYQPLDVNILYMGSPNNVSLIFGEALGVHFPKGIVIILICSFVN